MFPPALLQCHPQSRWQRHWQVVQVGLVSLPFTPLLGCACILLSALAIWQQAGRKLLRQPVTRGFGLLSVWLILTCWFAFKPDNAWLGLANFLPFFLVFPALSELIKTPEQLRRIADIIIVTAIPVSIIGLGQLYGGWAGQLDLPWLLIKWTIDPTGNPPGRMSSLFFYANVLASYLVTAFILSGGLWLETWSTRSAQRPRSPLSLVYLTLTTALTAIALVLTNSRNAWAVALIACLILALYFGWRWIVVAVTAIAGVMLGAAFAPLPVAQPLRLIVPAFFWARLNDQMYSDRPLNQLRSTQWQFAQSLAQQRPLTGWGLRNFTPLYEAQMHLWLGHPHNLLMMMWAETGIPGALMLFGLVGYVVARAVNLLRCGQPCSDENLLSVKPENLNAVSGHGRSPARDRGILLIFLTGFFAVTLFSLLDITFFDVRINLINWLMLSAIWGVAQHDKLSIAS